MKTAITVINTIQTGMDSYKDVRTTKVFDDSSTLADIKTWVRNTKKSKLNPENISIGSLEISDVY